MKKTNTLLFLLFFCFNYAFALLPDGATAPNWTLTDMNGNSHTLYEVLEDGKSAVIDFSTTWCGPCWNYHQTGTLETVYENFGPDGTDQVRVYFIESDDATNDACMFGQSGCSGNSQGNWMAGTNFPMFNPADETVPSSYQANSYPTLIAVCPNKKLYEVGQASVSTWESWLTETCALAQDFLTTEEDCYGDGNGSIDLTVTGGTGSKTFSWSNGATTEDLEGISAGTYSCTITEGRGHSIETGDITIGGPTEPMYFSYEEAINVNCNGAMDGSIEVIASSGVPIVSYQWESGETGSSIDNLSPNTYTVVATDQNNCTAIGVYEITEPEVLSSIAYPQPDNCDSGSGSIFTTTEGGTEPYTYYLDGVEQSSGDFFNLSAGSYLLQIIDANNCTYELATTVENTPGPTAEATADGDLSCDNNTVTLNGSSSESGSNIFFSWSTDDGTIDSGANEQNAVVSATGTYVLEVKDINTDCTSTFSIEVTSSVDAPTSQSSVSGELNCTVSELTLSGEGSSEGDNITYEWVTENGNIVSGSNTLNPVVNAAGTYTLVVTNSDNGCTTESSVDVAQSADVPLANAGDAMDITCTNVEITLNGSYSGAGDNANITWTTEDGNIVSGANTVNPVVNQSGTYLLEVVNPDNNCVALSSVVVEENTEAPSPEISDAEMLTCTQTEVTLSLENSDQYSSISWTTEDGNIKSGADSANPIVDQAGTYSVNVISTENGCTSTISIEVMETINNPVAQFTSEKDDTAVNFSSEGSQGGVITYLWEFGDGSTSTEANPIHTYAENADYEVCLTVTNECGSDKSCETVTISSGSSLDISINVEMVKCNAACDGSISIDVPGDVENYTIAITGQNGYSSEEFSNADLCAGTYEYTVTNEINESVTGTIEITEPELLEINDQVVTNVACNGEANGSISLTISGGTGEYQINWSNDESTATIDDLTADKYTAEITDENGCKISQEFEITEPTKIELTDQILTNSDENQSNGAINITVDGGTAPYTYLWSNGDETEDVSDLDPGEYKVIVTDANNCKIEFGPFKIETIISVNEIDDLEYLNVLPNPVSDHLFIDAKFENNKDLTISIINKLGLEVSSVQRRGIKIDEVLNVSEYPAGLYFIVIKTEDQSVTRKFVKM